MTLWAGTPAFRLTRDNALLFTLAASYLNRAFERTELVCDAAGLRIAERLGWDFVTYATALDDFCPAYAKHAWALGKIHASAIQTEPHMLVDLDVLLYHLPPRRVRAARVAVQSFDEPVGYLSPDRAAIREFSGLPREGAPLNVGVLSWTDLALRDAYVTRARAIAVAAAKQFGDGTAISLIAEQFWLGCLLRESGVRPETLIPLPSIAAPHDFEDAAFTHLWAETKTEKGWAQKVDARLARDFPAQSAACLRGYELLKPRLAA